MITTCIHDGWIAIVGIPANVSHEFLFYSIASTRSQNYFVNQAAGSGVQNLNTDIVKALKLQLPEESEQTAIAETLASLDALIAAEAEKLEALKTHKKGLMQQLFPSVEEEL